MRYRIVDADMLPSLRVVGRADMLPSLRVVGRADTLEALRDEVGRLIAERDSRPTHAELLAAVGNSEFARVVGEACETAVWDEWYGETGGEG